MQEKILQAVEGIIKFGMAVWGAVKVVVTFFNNKHLKERLKRTEEERDRYREIINQFDRR